MAGTIAERVTSELRPDPGSAATTRTEPGGEGSEQRSVATTAAESGFLAFEVCPTRDVDHQQTEGHNRGDHYTLRAGSHGGEDKAEEHHGHRRRDAEEKAPTEPLGERGIRPAVRRAPRYVENAQPDHRHRKHA